MNNRKEPQNDNRRAAGRLLGLLLALLLPAGFAMAAPRQQAEEPKPPAAPSANRIAKEGVSVEARLLPAEGASKVMAGEAARVELVITDANTGNPVRGVRPTAWLSYHTSKEPLTEEACATKIKSFMKGTLRSRPDVDLNTFYILALNKESSISVIDPLLGFGTSKLYTLIMLKGPGGDWRLDDRKNRLYVTVPSANLVTVVETHSWKVVGHVEIGYKPSAIALQSDGQYLWVSHDNDNGPGGVVAIDTDTLKIAGHVATGSGRQEIAFSAGDRFAFVTSEKSGSLWVIDTGSLALAKEVKIGRAAASLAFSPLAKAIYVTDPLAGEIVAIDAESFDMRARIKTRRGATTIRFEPEGRWGFIANPKIDEVHIVDAARNLMAYSVAVGRHPDQFVFSATFAYVRSRGSERVSMIKLSDLGKQGSLSLFSFAAGQSTPDPESGGSALMMVAAAGGDSVMVANPVDKTIYYYMEGMAAPMGSFQNYRREPNGVIIVDRSLKETAPGVFSTTARMAGAGPHDLLFFLDSPRMTHCFPVTVEDNPVLASKRRDRFPVLEYLTEERRIEPGKPVTVRFRLSDGATKKPRADLKDVGFMTFLAPGVWQNRGPARHVGDGVYEARFTAPREGIYYVYVQVPSLGARYNNLPYLIFEASAPAQTAAAETAKTP